MSKQIDIIHRRTRAVLWSGEAASTKEAIEKAVTARANLAGAYLDGADLDGGAADRLATGEAS